MPMTCKVCGHKKRREIDRALLEGQSLRDIARRTGTTASSLQRHKAEHLARSLVKAHEAREVARADSLLAQVLRQEARYDELDEDAKAIQESALEENDRRAALDAISVRGTLAHRRRPYPGTPRRVDRGTCKRGERAERDAGARPERAAYARGGGASSPATRPDRARCTAGHRGVARSRRAG